MFFQNNFTYMSLTTASSYKIESAFDINLNHKALSSNPWMHVLNLDIVFYGFSYADHILTMRLDF